MPYKVKSKCKDCGSETSHPKSIRCGKCSRLFRKGKNHPQWKGGKPNCIYCGVKLSTRKSIRCRHCKINDGLKEGHTFINDSGYIMEYKPSHPFCNSNGYIRQHRLIMEIKLGRKLKKNEIVHHINEIKTDNRISNLKLFKNSRDHTLHHDLPKKGIKTRFKKGQIPWNKKEKTNDFKSKTTSN